MADTMIKSLKILPAVCATQRTYILSDGIFYNVFEDGSRSPVEVVRHGVRATNNSVPKKDRDGAYEEKDVRNLQKIDSAKTDPNAKSVDVEFGMSFLDLNTSLSSVAGDNDSLFRENFDRFTKIAKQSQGVVTVAQRYARNILNGRWLFRNRQNAKKIRITVEANNELIAEEDAQKLPLQHFNEIGEQERVLADVIVRGLRGEGSEKLTVRASIEFLASGAIEVCPSQNYTDGGSVSRSLYVLNKEHRINTDDGPARVGDAALRDQKIANAIRTIDTWYRSSEEQPRPIPVEQYGANLDELKFFRKGKKDNAYYYMRNLGELDPNSYEGMFMIACLVRGAVYAGDKGE